MRADDKANTMFRFYGVVAALSIGLVAGNWSPGELGTETEVVFWAGCASLLASGFYLGLALYPWDIRGTPPKRLLYFGHVIVYDSVDALADALRNVEEDVEHRLVEQLLGISRLVDSKRRLMRRALLTLGLGTVVVLVTLIADSVVS